MSSTNRRTAGDRLIESSVTSFRDPHSHVRVGDRVERRFDLATTPQAQRFLASTTFTQLVDANYIDRPLRESLTDIGQLTLEHEPVQNWNLPWEWSWSMLRDAAIVHLDILDVCAADGWGMSDATSFNLVFRDGRPLFIDHGSFVERAGDEPWWAYTQFCEHFLYPLMISSHTGAALAPLLRGGLGRVSLADANAILRSHKRRRGVLKYVMLPHLAASKTDMSVSEVNASTTTGMSTEIYRKILAGLRATIERLKVPGGGSTWSDYAARAHYSAGALKEKVDFVERVVAAQAPACVLDIGANDGHFAKVAANYADQVIAADGDALVVDRLYRSNPPSNLLPLVLDATNPSPNVGWRGLERTSFSERVSPDLVLSLAVFHHMVFTGNIPLEQLALWMADIDSDFVIEFVHRADDKVQHLLSRKTEPDAFRYDLESFLGETARFFAVEERQLLSNNTRSMLHLRRI